MAAGLTPTGAARVLDAMAGGAVVVIGDLFLDEYLVGRPERLSREGPVPVLAFSRRFCLPGGAANPARNVAGLGAVARQVGVTGQDAEADDLVQAITEGGIDPCGIVADPARPTTVKTRVVAEGIAVGHQVARMDRQDRAPISGLVEHEILRSIARCARGTNALLVSHYRSGVVTQRVCQAVREAARENGALLAADAQGDLDWFTEFDIVRVGRGDAARGLGTALDTESDYERAALALRERLGARAVLLGRGAAGTSVADEAGYAVVPPANVSEVFDVSGAGDTVIAVVTLAVATGVRLRDAVALANFAAGIVVRRLGVAAPRPDEILAEIGAGRRDSGG